MNCVIPLHQMPERLVQVSYKQQTSSRATPEQRVKGLLGFPFSALIRAHTIQELLKDPETADIVKSFLSR